MNTTSTQTRTPNVPARLVNAGAVTYKHREAGFSLLIPMHLQTTYQNGRNTPETSLRLGSVVLRLHHKSRTVHGFVPDSWLVDLNADSACEDLSEPDDENGSLGLES